MTHTDFVARRAVDDDGRPLSGQDIGEVFAKVLAECARREEADLAALAASPAEHTSDTMFRCPACGWRSTPAGADLYDVYGEGEHNIECQRCGAPFRVVTVVTYLYLSPERRPS